MTKKHNCITIGMKNKFLIITIFIFVASYITIDAAPILTPDVFINEIAWMGTKTSANDEWMELKNNTNQDIKLDGWLLKTTNGKLKIHLGGKIPANGFYLLERTDDASVPGIKADFIYTGALNNSGGSLELYKNAGTLIDVAAFSSAWPAGDNATKKTMEREDAANWKTSLVAEGTPGTENSLPIQEIAELPKEPIVEAAADAEPIAKPVEIAKIEAPKTEALVLKTYPAGIIISEILPAPDGPDETNEWIELYNENSVGMDLSGWKIKDVKGTTVSHTFGAEVRIPANGYLVLKRPETKITLNNDEDGLLLVYPNGQTADSINYKEALGGESYNRIGSQWQWSPTLTPGAQNIVSQKKVRTALLKKELSGNGIGGGTNTASISDAADTDGGALAQIKKPWLIFLAALIAIISATAILLLKLKFKNERP